MTTDINTLPTALYVKIDDWLVRPRRSGRPPKLSDAELLTIAVAQALLGIRSEARWLRFLPAAPVECGRSRPTVKRSDLARWTGHGYCSSHSRFFWGLRLHLIRTPAGLPIAWTLATPKTDERHILTAALEDHPALLAGRPGCSP